MNSLLVNYKQMSKCLKLAMTTPQLCTVLGEGVYLFVQEAGRNVVSFMLTLS